ncbi:hypothetical protein DUI87_18768 [Hirundo rustica rustica]|uniref:Uncharacterized protein n=1 Tax=Hirundo rustica rustica TaxID=333673 RepID=A0A3M0JZI6_HIRRU|nr:hypothetical protein DUI87_18768 [Hirundo rustica rustica]
MILLREWQVFDAMHILDNSSFFAQQSESQSFAQRLQLRVPSMETLFRSPVKETLFRSSFKESLVRSSSRDSLNRLDLEALSPTFDSPSDIESETEEPLGNLDSFSKEQLLQRLRRMECSLCNYRGKYSELVSAYQVMQREKKKLQELQMDQQAKKHLQEEFDASLEEKDQLISVLQTQVSLLKQRLQNGQIGTELPDQNVQSEPQVQSPMEEVSEDNIVELGSHEGNEDSVKTLETLNQRVKHQENLLQRCKETIPSHKECCAQLTNEKEALQEQLEERLQELEKMKDLHMAEKSKLITQLRDAKNLIEQLEQDKAVTEEKETKGAISISTQTVTEAEQPKPVAVAPVPKKKSKSKSVRIVTDEDVAGPSHPAEETEPEIITLSLSLGELRDLQREFTHQAKESILTWLLHIWDAAASDTILDGSEARQQGLLSWDVVIDQGIRRTQEILSLWW